MTPEARKARMRREIMQRIGALPPEERVVQEARLADRLVLLPGFGPAQVVLIHVAVFAEEVATKPMLQTALEAGKRLICPKVNSDRRELELREVTDPKRDLVAGFRGIPEPGPGCRVVGPREVDWVLVPGLAFDRRGYRLGRGGGYYDRLLPTLRPDAARWALIFAAQWVEQVPTEPHDKPVDGVADPTSTWKRPLADPITGASPGAAGRSS